MPSSPLDRNVHGFFERFVEAFATFDGARVGALYHVPGIALRDDGSVDRIDTREQIDRFFQAALDGYRGEGCRRARFLDLDVVPLGGRSAVGTVTWELVADDDRVIRRWRQSYNLIRVGDAWQVLASTAHVAG